MNLTWKAKLGTIATGVAIVGGLLTVMNQAQVAEPHWLATRGFVREADMSRKVQIDRGLNGGTIRSNTLEAAIINGRRDAARNSIVSLKLLLQKDGSISSDYRTMIEQQLSELDDKIRQIDRRLDILRQERVALEREAGRN